MKTIVLVGAAGSMGRRYQAILKHFGARAVLFDPAMQNPYPFLDTVGSAVRASDGVIIASPTATHAAYCISLADAGVPILCEKPVSTDLDEVEAVLDRVSGPFRMMAQYTLLNPFDDGETFYDFYHSGSDGLAWDCIQLLGLARGFVTLRDESPIWRCTLNGRILSLDDVGWAYVEYVKQWLDEPEPHNSRASRDWILRAHRIAARL